MFGFIIVIIMENHKVMDHKRILLVSTCSYAGMGPYASSIINIFDSEDDVYCFLVEDEKEFYTKNISSNIKKRSIIVKCKNTKWRKLKSFFLSSNSLIRLFDCFCRDKKIDNIHFLTNDVMFYKSISFLRFKYNLYFTIHDLLYHESKKAFHKRFREQLLYKRLDIMQNRIENLITNSHDQFSLLKQEYPSKNIYFHEFPSLITEAIMKGNEVVKELKGVENYILFFGRIEKYKGIELLYESFINYCDDLSVYLVIAGSGDIYFQRNINREDRVIFINRYIADEEVADLFKKAHCVIYPYISATQSGVLSLSCYFKRPTLTSDVPFFTYFSAQDVCLTFRNGNAFSLLQKLNYILKNNMLEMQKKQEMFYIRHYKSESLRDELLSIYK